MAVYGLTPSVMRRMYNAVKGAITKGPYGQAGIQSFRDHAANVHQYYVNRRRHRNRLMRRIGELKAYDLNAGANTAITADSGQDFHLLNGIAAGAQQSQRVGQRITMRSIDVRFHLHRTSGLEGDYDHATYCEVVLFIDDHPQDADPAWADVFENAIVPDLSMTNFDNRDRFRILRRQTYILAPVGRANSQSNDPMGVQDHWHVKINRETHYHSNLATIEAIKKGALYIAFASAQAAGDDSVEGGLCARLRYNDI